MPKTKNHNCRYLSGEGYVLIKAINHPNSHKNGYCFEHILMMSNNLKRALLKDEIVHHINGIKSDNRIENLCLTDRKTHYIKIHGNKNNITKTMIKNSALIRSKKSDNLGRYQCSKCQIYKLPYEFAKRNNRKTRLSSRCKGCLNGKNN